MKSFGLSREDAQDKDVWRVPAILKVAVFDRVKWNDVNVCL